MADAMTAKHPSGTATLVQVREEVAKDCEDLVALRKEREAPKFKVRTLHGVLFCLPGFWILSCDNALTKCIIKVFCVPCWCFVFCLLRPPFTFASMA